MTTGKFNCSLLLQQESTLFVGLGVLLKISAEAEYLYLKFTEKPQAKILKNENYLLGIFLVHCLLLLFFLFSYLTNYFSVALYRHNNFYQSLLLTILNSIRKGKVFDFFSLWKSGRVGDLPLNIFFP